MFLVESASRKIDALMTVIMAASTQIICNIRFSIITIATGESLAENRHHPTPITSNSTMNRVVQHQMISFRFSPLLQLQRHILLLLYMSRFFFNFCITRSLFLLQQQLVFSPFSILSCTMGLQQVMMQLKTCLWKKTRMMSSASGTLDLRRSFSLWWDTSLTEKMPTVEHNWLIYNFTTSFALQQQLTTSTPTGYIIFFLFSLFFSLFLCNFRASPGIFFRLNSL